MLFEPTERKSLASVFADAAPHHPERTGQRPQPALRADARQRRMAARASCPALPKFGSASARAVDADESDDYFLTVSDYLTPVDALVSARSASGQPEKLKQRPRSSTPKGLTVSQHEATSKDGTKIPYFQVSRNGPAL